MAPTKNELADGVTNQQALVKRLVGSSQPKPTKTIIPGGKYLLNEVDQKKLQAAVFTWLRRHRWFDYVRISFSKDPDSMDLKVEKVQDFPQQGQYAVWELPAQGKRWLSEKIADQLASRKLIYIEAKRDGLYIATEKKESDFGPDSDTWEPYVEMLPIRRGEYEINR